MSQSHASQVSVSGLSAIKRDFSSNTQVVKTEPAPAAKPAMKKSMLSDAMRRAIEQGVASRGTASTSAVLSQKRPSQSAPEPQPAKRRQLPDSWSSSSSSSAPRTLSRTSTLPSTSTYNATQSSSAGSFTLSEQRPLVIPAVKNNNKSASKPASIFLSKEQRAILKLVEKGDNIFYTGSAGEFPSWAVISLYAP
ncbi:hypothetical protein OF83DRAFT_31747 [Amylostereum chailletii]|nr:hypothetical protein OF83DRAFT_31747 [Amylostereum chailletii]